MNISNFKEELAKIGINITDNQIEQLEKYYNLLIEWNNKINLTGITKHEDVYLKHFYDSATLFKIIDLNKIDSLCDIGTGAGFPGVVLKILFPNLKITLIDSLNKRIVFLNEVIKELGLTNIDTIVARAEEYSIKNREKYDVVTARAVAPLSILLEYSVPLVKKNGYFIAMKSDVSEELSKISNCEVKLNIKLDNKLEFYLPYENSLRTLVSFRKISETNKIYPRRYSEIKKRPL